MEFEVNFDIFEGNNVKFDISKEGTFVLNLDTFSKEAILSEKFCKVLIHKGINVLFCQKLVKPTSKSILLQNGIFIIDRLAIDKINEIIAVTCTKHPLKQFNNEIYPESIGFVDKITFKRLSYNKVDTIVMKAVCY